MQKELNPELFGEKKIVKSSTTDNASSLGNSGSYLNTDRQIFELRSQNQNLHNQMEKIVASVNEWIKSSNVKFEKQAASLTRLEQNHNGLATEAGQKISQLSAKVNERRSLDAKIQEMVDRHNNIVKSFEVRMNHMQKLLAEKESQVIASQAAINEAKMEIARLKRL